MGLDINVETRTEPAKLLYASNQTGASLTDITSTPMATLLSEPSGDGYLRKSTGEGFIPNIVVLSFFGTDANNETIAWRVSGVERIISSGTTQWIRSPIASGTGILGQMVGIANGVVDANQFFADTISITNNSNLISTPTTAIDGGRATLQIDVQGYEDIFVEVARGTAATVNAMARTI